MVPQISVTDGKFHPDISFDIISVNKCSSIVFYNCTDFFQRNFAPSCVGTIREAISFSLVLYSWE
jgi:hypothetical protein